MIVRGRFRRPAARIVVLIDRSVDPRGRARKGKDPGRARDGFASVVMIVSMA
jgi:hypothetical protein